MTRFIFVRHGQTEWNRVERFRGRADIPLNATGMEQAQRASARLAETSIAAIYASPLSRTRRTAEIIAAPHHLAISSEPGLLDLDYGAWQGKTPEEVAASDPKRYAQWQTQPDRVRIPGGETLRQLRARVIQLMDDSSHEYPGETVVFVSHDIVGKILMCAVLGLDNNAVWRIAQDNAALDIFTKRESGFFAVLTMNDAAHLMNGYIR